MPEPDRPGQPRGAGAQAGLPVVQPGGRLRRGLQLRDVPRPRSACRRPSPASPRIGCFGANLVLSGTDAQRRRACSCRAATSRCCSCTPALGRLIRPERRPPVGESHVVVLSHAYWTTRFAADPNVLNQHAHRQRPDADDRRRGAARLRRHDARHQAASVRADHDAGARWSPGFNGDGTIARSTGRTSSRDSKPGVAIEYGARGANASVPRDRQRRRGAAAEGHERPDDGALQEQADRRRAGRTRAELDADGRADAALAC